MSTYGILVSEDNILVTCGAQHALTVILSTLCKPGDRVLTEALTYPVFKKLAAQLQLRLVPVAMDKEGLIPEDLDAACSKNNVRVLYTIPTIHNPTNACLSEERRTNIALIAQKHDLWIIEDDCYALAMPNRPIPLFNLAPERTCFIAGLSKFLGGGLRIGFLAAPRRVLGDLSMAVTNTTWMASPLTAEIVTKWIEDGKADSIIQIRRKNAEERNHIAAECLKGFDYQGYQNSYFIWLNLPEPWSGENFEKEALNRGIGLAAAERFIVGQTPLPKAVRVSLFGPRNPVHLQKGLITIKDILNGIPGTPRELI
jgi:DNA-binding transcriptional MocR family regulator